MTIQDSHIEIHKLVLRQQESLAPGHALPGGPLQDQERPRHAERQREEPAHVHQLQHQLQQEQRRWLRTCAQQQREQEAKEGRLQAREQECRSREELLLRGRGELAQQLQEYRQSLERLREGQRLVEQQKERVRAQQGALGRWRHGRQRSLPAAFSPFPSGSEEVGASPVSPCSLSEHLGARAGAPQGVSICRQSKPGTVRNEACTS